MEFLCCWVYVLTLFVASLCRVAWLIGWALILEYTIGGSAVARGISPNLVSGIPLHLMCPCRYWSVVNLQSPYTNSKTKTLCFQAIFFGGQDNLPWILARHEIPWLDVVVDPCAAFLVFVVTGLLCVGIKEVATFSNSVIATLRIFWECDTWSFLSVIFFFFQSSFVQGVVTVLNCFVMLFVIIAGSYIGFQTGWVGYKVAGG